MSRECAALRQPITILDLTTNMQPGDTLPTNSGPLGSVRFYNLSIARTPTEPCPFATEILLGVGQNPFCRNQFLARTEP